MFGYFQDQDYCAGIGFELTSKLITANLIASLINVKKYIFFTFDDSD